VSAPLFPLFLKLEGRRALVVGGGPVALQRVRQLAEAGARVAVVAPEVLDEIAPLAAEVARRPFRAGDVDGAWLAIAAATPEVNRAVARACEARGVYVNAVDDLASATAYCAGVVRRGGAVVAISTEGRAPALAGLLREAIEAVLPEDLERWMLRAEELRAAWKKAKVAMKERRPLLLRALNELYERSSSNANPTPTPTSNSNPTSTSTPTPTPTPTATATGSLPLSPTLPPLGGGREKTEGSPVTLRPESRLPPPPRGRAGERVCTSPAAPEVTP
jgi:uroporphyrin-III C-methyltransferase/precorrin-2 dehydrogenase/sirohydrochlorin ferrochelatase